MEASSQALDYATEHNEDGFKFVCLKTTSGQKVPNDNKLNDNCNTSQKMGNKIPLKVPQLKQRFTNVTVRVNG